MHDLVFQTINSMEKIGVYFFDNVDLCEQETLPEDEAHPHLCGFGTNIPQNCHTCTITKLSKKCLLPHVACRW
jgi:hypothetical protein